MLGDLAPSPLISATVGPERRIEASTTCLLAAEVLSRGRLDRGDLCWSSAEIHPLEFLGYWCRGEVQAALPEELGPLSLEAMELLEAGQTLAPVEWIEHLEQSAARGRLEATGDLLVDFYLARELHERIEGAEGEAATALAAAERSCIEHGLAGATAQNLPLWRGRFYELMSMSRFGTPPEEAARLFTLADLEYSAIQSTYYQVRNRGNYAVRYESNGLSWQEARPWLEEAVGVTGADGNVQGAASFLITLAGGEYDAANLGRAADLYQRALNLGSCGSVLRYTRGLAQVGLGSVYLDLGDEERALLHYHEVISSPESSKDSKEYINAFANTLFIQIEQIERGERPRDAGSLALLGEGLDWAERRADPSTFGALPLEIRLARARTRALAGQVEEAEALALTVQDQARRARQVQWVIASALLLGDLRRSQAQLDEAVALYREARQEAAAARMPYWVWSALQKEASLMQQLGRRPQVMARLDEAATVVEQVWQRVTDYAAIEGDGSARFLESKVGFYDEAVETLLSGQPRPEEVVQAWWWTERRRSNELRRRLGLEAPAEELGRHDRAEEHLRQIRARLGAVEGPRQVLLEYHVGVRGGWIFVITPEGLAVRPISAGEGALQALVRRAFPFLGAGARGAPVESAALGELSSALLTPVVDLLRPGDLLRVVPDGALTAVPWELLSWPGGAGAVLDHFLVAYLGSAAGMLRPSPPQGAAGPVLSLANSAGAPATAERAALPPVPCAAAESARVIQGREGDVALVDEQATEAEFRRRAPSADVVHLTAHGVIVDGAWWQSHVLLEAGEGEDGRLTVEEIAQLRLRARLVILSVCRSAISRVFRGEGVQGLATAFRRAGVPATVAGLWELPDVVGTVELIGQFMDRIHRGESAALALREAKRVVRDAGASPRVWAPVVLFGEVGALGASHAGVRIPPVRGAMDARCEARPRRWGRLWEGWRWLSGGG